MKTSSQVLRHAIQIVPIVTGLAVGWYVAGFWALAQSGFQSAVLCPPLGLLGIGLVSGVALTWATGWGTRWLGQRVLGLAPEQARLYAAVCDLPLLVLPMGLALTPWLNSVGNSLSLDVLGILALPWQQEMIHLPAQGYLLLLWAGPAWTLTWFLRLLIGGWRFVQPAPTARPPLRLWSLAAAAGIFFLALGLWTTLVVPPTGDEPHYLLMAHSLKADQDLDLRNNMEQKDYQRFYPVATLDFHATPTPTGHMFSKHFPLLALILLPGYAVAGRHGAVAIILLCAVGISLCLYRIGRLLGLSEATAFKGWLLAVASAPLAVYFDLIYTELPAALLVLCGLWAWLQGGGRGAWITALVAGALPWLYPKYIPLAACLGGLFLFTSKLQRRFLLGPFMVILLSAVGYIAFFYTYYGFGISQNPYGTLHGPWEPIFWRNALGLWVDRDFGMWATSPGLILSAIGWFILRSQQPRPAAVWLGLMLVQVLLYCSFDDFTGSSAMFSRAMIPAALALWPLAAMGWEAMQKQGRLARVSAQGVILAGIVLAWLCAAWPLLRYVSPKLKLWSRLGFAPALFPMLSGVPDALAWGWAGLGMIVILAGIGLAVKSLRLSVLAPKESSRDV